MARAQEHGPTGVPRRQGGFAPLRDYAVIGDGRVAALIARDGAIDWLCASSFDGPSVFAAILDPLRGGAFTLAPRAPFEVERRYVEATNVLETTFTTATGVVRVTDALTMEALGELPWRELARRIEGVSGRVELAWRVEPRFDWGQADMRCERRGDMVLARGGRHLAAVQAWDAGDPVVRDAGAEGTAVVEEGASALLCLTLAQDEPLAVPAREAVERRLGFTARAWRDWAGRMDYDGPVREAVRRSALALGLLADGRRGAIVGAATTSLPESLGGQSNFDYRLAWLRDGSFALDALLHLGFVEHAQAAFSFLMAAGRTTHPRLGPIYDLDGRPRSRQTEIDLQGYMGSQPVRVGNAAASQHQFGGYGDTLTTAALFVSKGHVLDDETVLRLPELADHVCDIWHARDSSFWELPDRREYTFSKMACWGALSRAIALAEEGHIRDRSIERWREEAAAIDRFLVERCWSEARQAWRMHTETDDLDTTVLLAVRIGYHGAPDPDLTHTMAALRDELGRGPLLYRFSGTQGQEGCFVACSFWLVEALVGAGRVDEGEQLLEELVGLANDVGLYTEEIEPDGHEFRGNMPQGLSHLGLINAAAAVGGAQRSSVG
ncbi:MAG: glycoside hydrolase family 15 protein [Actinomycetota bacterium]|nr:glycoside hydrolase family 15 protein [Actinomycetota bacterium]